MTQTFSKWIMIAEFTINRNYMQNIFAKTDTGPSCIVVANVC